QLSSNNLKGILLTRIIIYWPFGTLLSSQRTRAHHLKSALIRDPIRGWCFKFFAPLRSGVSRPVPRWQRESYTHANAVTNPGPGGVSSQVVPGVEALKPAIM
ncbi:hypothetical protein, partial [Actinosynnema sp. NPDC000082]|uniref:hypothetical protein n=1 Tax=Actinosynnema sp. NPDC000082 TaxID=3363910 RepID=UPI0036BFC1A9